LQEIHIGISIDVVVGNIVNKQYRNMNTVQGYISELQANHTVIVDKYLNAYRSLQGKKDDAAVIAFAKEYDGRISREIAGTSTDLLLKSMMEGLEGDQIEYITAVRQQSRAAYAEYIYGLNTLLVGDQRLGIQY
jgi:hypothetical protein